MLHTGFRNYRFSAIYVPSSSGNSKHDATDNLARACTMDCAGELREFKNEKQA